MISNEHQYRVAKAQLANLREAFDSFDVEEARSRVGSRALALAERAALQSEVDELERQLSEYDRLRSGKVVKFEAVGLEELPTILLQARIARGYTHRTLADILGMTEQQVQRYEADRYAGANLRRLAEVAAALGLQIKETAELQEEASS